jgi:hypothetical protein
MSSGTPSLVETNGQSSANGLLDISEPMLLDGRWLRSHPIPSPSDIDRGFLKQTKAVYQQNPIILEAGRVGNANKPTFFSAAHQNGLSSVSVSLTRRS